MMRDDARTGSFHTPLGVALSTAAGYGLSKYSPSVIVKGSNIEIVLTPSRLQLLFGYDLPVLPSEYELGLIVEPVDPDGPGRKRCVASLSL